MPCLPFEDIARRRAESEGHQKINKSRILEARERMAVSDQHPITLPTSPEREPGISRARTFSGDLPQSSSSLNLRRTSGDPSSPRVNARRTSSGDSSTPRRTSGYGTISSHKGGFFQRPRKSNELLQEQLRQFDLKISYHPTKERLIRELINNENDFIRDLQTVAQVFVEPLHYSGVISKGTFFFPPNLLSSIHEFFRFAGCHQIVGGNSPVKQNSVSFRSSHEANSFFS